DQAQSPTKANNFNIGTRISYLANDYNTFIFDIDFSRNHYDNKQGQLGTITSLVSTRQGRSKESGTKLTPRAMELMENYSILQKDIEEYANKRFKELFLKGKK
ncbi:hypothetical protein, partial [Campylobacter jejuni]|uniref:hypothetical protein n=1 Tax=Campylobacter jejuni TaxID=197 RepID=UPI001F2FFBE6